MRKIASAIVDVLRSLQTPSLARLVSRHLVEAGQKRKRGERSEDPELEALKLRFEDLRRENERLRDARSAITAQLGPLPISAAIVAGLVSGFALGGKTHLHERELYLALWLFGAMVLVSMLASTFRPYRKLRDKAIEDSEDPDAVDPEKAKSAKEWYTRMIKLEETLRGTSVRSGFWAWLGALLPIPVPFRAKSLQSACDQEWKGLFLTKSLFVAVIVLLILAGFH
jgi:hypothetical protein